MTVYFLIPVYNEEPNIELLAQNLKAVLPQEKKFFIFSDDGSKDKTGDMIRTHFAGTDFIILGDGTNHGPGYAFNTGFEWIHANAKDEADIIVTLEADNTSDLGILPVMIANHRMGFNLVLASVYAQGGGFDKTTFFRKLFSAVANLMLRFLFNIRVQTLSSFYRVYSLPLLREIKTHHKNFITETGFLCMIEILIKAIKREARILEVPMVLYSAKRKGKSKMKTFKTMMSYVRFFLFKRV